MAFCKKCGKELQDDAKFCGVCGEPTEPSKESSNSASDSVANDAFEKTKEQVEKVLDTKDYSEQFDKEEVEKNKVICALSYFGILFFLPLILCPKGSKYAKFHANQSLLILILSVVANIVFAFIGLIPVLGTILHILINIVIFAAFLFGLINTLMGKSKELPFIGGIRIIN